MSDAAGDNGRPISAAAHSARSAAAPPIIEARAVHKTYWLGRVAVPVLRGASISVREGEWLAILGASGSGKSTLLHLLGGLDRVDAIAHVPSPALTTPTLPSDGGSVAFRGVALESMTERARSRYRNESVGFVFQFYHLLPELSVLENVLIPAMARYGRLGFAARSATLRARGEQLLTAFGLAHRLKHRPAELSGGERQRVAIARALINDPPLLLADEPTGNLDRKTGEAILDQIADQRRRDGRTLVMVTHDRTIAERADRVVELEDGQVVTTFSPQADRALAGAGQGEP